MDNIGEQKVASGHKVGEDSGKPTCPASKVESQCKDDFDPYGHRDQRHLNSANGTLIHMLKTSMGSGIQMMPFAFFHAGLLGGVIGIVFSAILCGHCIHILGVSLLISANYELLGYLVAYPQFLLAYRGLNPTVAKKLDIANKIDTAVALSNENRIPCLSYSEIAEKTFQYGPKQLRPWSRFAKNFSTFVLIATYIGVLCVTAVLPTAAIKEIVDYYHEDMSYLPAQAYLAMSLIVLLPMTQINNLKYLVPISGTANCLLIFSFSITLYYLLRDPFDFSDKSLVVSPKSWPTFFTVALMSMEGIGSIMPLVNEMKHPPKFSTRFGVLNISMTFVAVLYGTIGFIGYAKYGTNVKGSITLNLPGEDILAQITKLGVAVAVLLTFSLHCYVVVDTIIGTSKHMIPERFHKVYDVSTRALTTILTISLSAVIPDLEAVMSLSGSLLITFSGIIIPAVLQTIHKINDLGSCYYILIKNIFIIILAIILVVTGTKEAVDSIKTKLYS